MQWPLRFSLCMLDTVQTADCLWNTFCRGSQTVKRPGSHNHFALAFKNSIQLQRRCFIHQDANEKAHLCVLLILIHQTTNGNKNSPCQFVWINNVTVLMLVFFCLFCFSSAAGQFLTPGIVARQVIWCKAMNIRDQFQVQTLMIKL